MKQILRRLGLLAILALTTGAAFATLDTLPIKIVDGRKYYYYTVKPKETVYSLCKRFGITEGQFVAANPSVVSGLKANQELLFPVDEPETVVSDYMVQKGESGYGIAHRFGMSLDDFYSLNPSAHEGLKVGQMVKVRREVSQSTSSQSVSVPAAPSASAMTQTAQTNVYEIRAGETLYQIAKRNGLSIKEIVDANPGLNVDRYAAGQRIIIPLAASTPTPLGKQYIVREGETLYGIASTFGISVDQLRAANSGLSAPEAGQVITIPDGCPEPSSVVGPIAVEEVRQAISDTVNIALVLPFNAAALKHDSKTNSLIEFYRGFVLALDNMRNQGRPVRLSVYDTKGTPEGIKEVLDNPNLKKANIIVGPQTADQMSQFARFALDNKIYLLNMFVVKDDAYLTNPYVMHNNIPHTTLYKKAIDYFISHNPDVVPVFLSRTEGKADKKEFVDEFKKELNISGRKYHDISYKQLSDATLNQLPAGVSYAFVPNSSKKDELDTFIKAILTYKEGAPDGAVKLWGYSEWLILRGENMKRLHDADTYLFSRFYSVVNDTSEQQLEKDYQNWYGIEMADKVPCQGTFGYDTAMYILNAVNVNGGDFSRQVPPYDGLQNAFDFIHIDNGGQVNNEMYIIHLAPGEFSSKLGI